MHDEYEVDDASGKDQILKDDRDQSITNGVTVRLIRQLLAILMVAVLIGAPAVQAAFAPPCRTVIAGASDRQLLSDHASVPTPTPCTGTPCKGMMPGCLDMLDCGINSGLPIQAVGVSHKLTWTSAVYRISTDTHEGLTVELDLHPPITI
jgi:hypothetical protein